MSRPTVEHVDHTAVLVRVLARDADPDYHLVARLVDRLAWLDGEIRDAERARSLPGASDVHVLGNAGGGVEGRLHDDLLRELRKLRRDWRRHLAMLEDGFKCTACQVRFTTGWQRGAAEVARLADEHSQQEMTV